MAYTINGKVYTHDAPLLDEIVHNTKLIQWIQFYIL